MPLDIFDEIDLSPEDKVLLSEDFRKIIVEEIKKEVGKLPIDKIINQVISKHFSNREKEEKSFKETTSKEISKSKTDIKTEMSKSAADLKNELESAMKSSISKIKEETTDFMEKIKKKYDDLRSEILNQPRYEFGGFPPVTGQLPITDTTTGDQWRLAISGTDLVVQKLESGTWNTKGTFIP